MADVLTDAGRAHIAGLVSNTVAAPANYFIAWGTGVGTAAVADTTLFTEVDARQTSTSTRVTTTVANDTAQYFATLSAGSARSITNAGVWTLVTGGAGTLVQKSDHATVPLVAGDSIAYTFKLKFA